MSDQILVAERVRKVYRTGAQEVAALRDVDLIVHEGEFVSVMGPSGSGKTTLLNCCSGLDDIDGGRVLLDDADLHLCSDAERTSNRASSMGFIFQAYNLIPVFNAVENVELPLLLAGVDAKQARRRALETLERVEIITGLRRGEFDVLVGINLLREGLDLPEVSLVAILDADKEGFLRSETSLIQTAGRAARNVNGRVIFYSDRRTDSMKKALDETERRRVRQGVYNVEHGIEPATILKDIHNPLVAMSNLDLYSAGPTRLSELAGDVDLPLSERISRLEKEMKAAAKRLEFEEAAALRDQIRELREVQIYAG